MLRTYFGEKLQQLPSPVAMVTANSHDITVHYSSDITQEKTHINITHFI